MATRVRVRRDVLFDADGLNIVAGDLDLEPVSEVLRTLEAARWSGALHLGDRGFASRVLTIDVSHGALLGGRVDDRALTAVEALREALSWPGRRFELFPAPTPPEALDTTTTPASLAELLRRVLSMPGAGPLGGRNDEDLPEISLRTPPTPRLDAPPLPSFESASDPRSHAPGHSLVESVRQRTRPDPRAESDE